MLAHIQLGAALLDQEADALDVKSHHRHAQGVQAVGLVDCGMSGGQRR